MGSPMCQVRRKPLFSTQSNQCLGQLLDFLLLPAHLIEEGNTVQSNSQTKRVRQLLGQSERFLAPLQGLVWVAKMTLGHGGLGLGGDRCVHCTSDMGIVLLGIVERKALLLVCAGLGKLS